MTDPFDAPDRPPAAPQEASLVLDIDGFEGPIDLLLTLARDQKVDLTRISILQLAEQYLAFVAEARRVRLELAADYLVMAAWLAYLKSRLLLPEPEQEQPSGEEMAAALAFQLQRLEAMQAAGARLMARPVLGRDVFARGAPEAVQLRETRVLEVTLYELLKAYGDHQRRRTAPGPLQIRPLELYSIEEALQRMQEMLGRLPAWTRLSSFLPSGADGLDSIVGKSQVASTFVALLELVKAGQAELRQDAVFGDIHVRRATTPRPQPKE
jgi:segregation and condensation protein A